MRGLWIVARQTLQECVRRRVFLVVPVATAGFIGLFSLGSHYAFQARNGPGGLVPLPLDIRVLTGSTLVGLSMFVTLFLASALGIFLTFSAIRGDAEQGMIQPLIVRPIARPGLLFGRFIGTSIVCATYAAFLYAASVTITWTIGSWRPEPLLPPALALLGAVEIVIVLSLLGSAFLTALPNGIAMFMLYGAGLLAGLLSQLGRTLGSSALETTGRVASWLLPFEALYQHGLYSLTATTRGVTGVVVRLGPLGGAEEGGPLLTLWVALYFVLIMGISLTVFAKRDL
ncbi:MAG: hypothetical protein M3280_09080 [Actinomycetota bacterium]|nr:hypothetical protein [Actinomycetota bacterium]